MPALTPCPIPDVERNLSAYVHSRDDALKIRRTLSKYITAALRPVNAATQNQHLNHECPEGCLVSATNPPGLDSIRKKYLDSLRARVAAQKRAEDVRASLEQLQSRHMLEAPDEGDTQYDDEVTQNYVALLRQRRRFAELQVIKDSLDKLLNARTFNGPQDPKMLVKDAIGEQPDLPVERLENVTRPKDDGPLVMKVKKEVLDARSSMEQAKSARAQAQTASPNSPSLEEQVYALGCARQEIVEWVQEELAKMEEESAFIEDASPVKRPIENDPIQQITPSESQIRDCYNRYTSSRSDAIASHDSVQHGPSVSTIIPAQSDAPQDADLHGQGRTKSSEVTMARFLPHLSNIFATDANERSILEQAVYMQTQIGVADENTADTLLRLSGESHLLPSGTRGIEAWGKTSTDTEAVNRDFVHTKLQESRQGVNSIKTIVELCSWQSKVLSSG